MWKQGKNVGRYLKKGIAKANEATFGGKLIKYEEQELYPKSNCFGAWAWCFTNYEKAIAKFQIIG